MEQTMEKVIKIITPYVKNQQMLSSATAQTKLMDDLGVNSARLVDIILDVEDAFSIEIDDASADQVRTIGDAVQLVLKKKSG